jgi:hypothetical protein
MIGFIFKEHGLQDILLFPPTGNIMNIADALLVMQWKDTWTEAFFGFAGLRSFERQVGKVELLLFSVLQRNSSNLHMTWTYDPSINFEGE